MKLGKKSQSTQTPSCVISLLSSPCAPCDISFKPVRAHSWLLHALALLLGFGFTFSAWAQKNSPAPASTPQLAPSEQTIESDPLRCWLKSTKTSVHIGEQFNVALTCAVIETARVSVIADVSQIEPASIQLAPFEVLGGQRHPDIKSGRWRYFQYEYTVRLIADGFFGQDLAVPPISLNYRVNMTGAGASQEGREKTYVLPQLPIRIVSLVPTIATDIRDAARDTFADIAERNFRATAAFVVAGILYAFAAAMVLIMLVRAFGTFRRRTPAAHGAMQPAAVSGATLRALGRIATARGRDGWTGELIAQGVAAARVAAAIATNRPIAQSRAAHDSVLQDGQLLIPRGWFKRGALLISASATPRALRAGDGPRATGLGSTVAPRPRSQALATMLDELHRALSLFSEARYAREPATSLADLDAALEQVRAVLRRLRLQLSWPVRTVNSWLYWWQSLGGPGWAR